MQTTQRFDPDPASAGAARRFVRGCLEAHGVGPEAAEYVVSELVTNVIEHARTVVEVALAIGRTVRIEVRDGNAIIPAVVDAADDAEHGRGLAIVDALAQSWGVCATAGGKMIWAELER